MSRIRISKKWELYKRKKNPYHRNEKNMFLVPLGTLLLTQSEMTKRKVKKISVTLNIPNQDSNDAE